MNLKVKIITHSNFAPSICGGVPFFSFYAQMTTHQTVGRVDAVHGSRLDKESLLKTQLLFQTTGTGLVTFSLPLKMYWSKN